MAPQRRAFLAGLAAPAMAILSPFRSRRAWTGVQPTRIPSVNLSRALVEAQARVFRELLRDGAVLAKPTAIWRRAQ